MIKIELQFSTIAEATAFLAGRDSTPVVVAADTKTEKAKAEGKAEKAKPSQQAAADSSAPATAAASSASSTKASASTDGDEIPYADLQKEVFKVAQLGGDAKAKVLEVAASLGSPTFKELPPAKWAAARDAVIALHAELTAEVA